MKYIYKCLACNEITTLELPPFEPLKSTLCEVCGKLAVRQFGCNTEEPKSGIDD